jgi:predicted metal-dependent HD superfamily phosphohydrolase
MPLNQARWVRLMISLGIPKETENFDALIAAYLQKHRHYHTDKVPGNTGARAIGTSAARIRSVRSSQP